MNAIGTAIRQKLKYKKQLIRPILDLNVRTFHRSILFRPINYERHFELRTNASSFDPLTQF